MKIKTNIVKREDYGEKNTIKIESEDKQIFLGFDSDGEAVVLKDCQVVVEDLFEKQTDLLKRSIRIP